MPYDCLIVEDEQLLADSTAEFFTLLGVPSKAVYTSAECMAFLEQESVRIILLDINLDDTSGFELCRTIRASSNVPIVFVSARASDDDVIAALTIGGDEYVQKPCSLAVLLAKIKALLKRCSEDTEDPVYDDGRLRVDTGKRSVSINGVETKLTPLEYRLLAYLVGHSGSAVTKQELFDNVWGDRFIGDGALNVHIRHLREAIERDPGNPQYIRTIRGVGYRFETAQ